MDNLKNTNNPENTTDTAGSADRKLTDAELDQVAGGMEPEIEILGCLGIPDLRHEWVTGKDRTVRCAHCGLYIC